MRSTEDRIAAIATAPGRAGIGIVRVSGKDLRQFATELIGRVPRPRYAEFARFRDAAGETMDEGVLLFFPAPHSFTGEDVVELQGHGGPVVLRMLLQRCVELGARLAEAGEFTQRAFLNDKLDLAQAEAVADLIDAATESAARGAMRSLSGEFSRAVEEAVDRLIELRAHIEATLDFPEEEIDPNERRQLKAQLETLSADLATLLGRARQGVLLRSGLHVVLAGQPNVGKSSLLNCLAGEDLAIVTPMPGTTRDTVRQHIEIAGLPLHIVDTAGLRDTADEVERIGIERTWAEVERADLVVLVSDSAQQNETDRALASRFPPRVPRLQVRNKIDLRGEPAGESGIDGIREIRCSAKTGAGIDLLRSAILRTAGLEAQGEHGFVARERHVAALHNAHRRVEEAKQAIANLEFAAEELRLAQEALSEIVGRFEADDLLGEIFGRFCIGK